MKTLDTLISDKRELKEPSRNRNKIQFLQRSKKKFHLQLLNYQFLTDILTVIEVKLLPLMIN
jgi:hypothetical protein